MSSSTSTDPHPLTTHDAPIGGRAPRAAAVGVGVDPVADGSTAGYEVTRLVAAATAATVGLDEVAQVLAVTLATGRHVVLEGPPGTGKSTLLRAVTDAAGVGLELVEGHAELTPSRLIGAHDPAAVLDAGYTPEAFVAGPLVRAVRDGSVLYLEELNRVPDETLNVLITALAEGEVHVPRAGRFVAAPGFRLVAAMNPFDAVGTARVGQALYDRLCRIVVGYLDAEGEQRVVAADAGHDPRLASAAVRVVRATRDHRDLRHGSSVRGAKDVAALVRGLADARGEGAASPATVRAAVHAALSGRIRVDDGCDRRPEEILDELLDRHWPDPDRGPDPDPDPGDAPRGDGPDPGGDDGAPPPDGDGEDDDRGDGDDATDPDGSAGASTPPARAPSPAPNRAANAGAGVHRGADARSAVSDAGRRRQPRTQLARTHARLEEVSPDVGVLDEAALDAMLADDADAAAALLVDLIAAVDPVLRDRARRLAARLALRVGRGSVARGRGVGRLTRRTGTDDGELDLDATLERAGGRPRHADELVVRRFAAPDRAMVLCIDRSGSMSGQQVLIAAAAAAGVLLAAEGQVRSGVVAFATDAVVLAGLDDDRPVESVVDEVLTLRGHGATDLALGLRVAAEELDRSAPPGTRRTALVLSDAIATAGDDPLRAVAGFDEVHVLGTSAAAESVLAAEALARTGRGSHQVVTELDRLAAGLRPLLC